MFMKTICTTDLERHQDRQEKLLSKQKDNELWILPVVTQN